MATVDQRNAVYNALNADIKELVNDLVPFFYRSTVMSEVTTNRVLKLVDDAITAYDKTLNKGA